MRNNPVQDKWELNMIHTGDNYVILSSGGINEIMHKKNFAQCLTDSITVINYKNYPQ